MTLIIISEIQDVTPYLGYYLMLVKDDRCSILENITLPRHFTPREEELSEIDVVCFERLSTLLHQGVEGGFENVALIEVESVVVGVSTLYA
jgi:hypothetical protein